MTIINCTPHILNIHCDNKVVNLKPSSSVARIATTSNIEEWIDSIPVYETTFGVVEGLPAPKEGVFLVVSRMVLTACPERKDLLSPGTLVRNDEGQPIGCLGLSR